MRKDLSDDATFKVAVQIDIQRTSPYCRDVKKVTLFFLAQRNGDSLIILDARSGVNCFIGSSCTISLIGMR